MWSFELKCSVNTMKCLPEVLLVVCQRGKTFEIIAIRLSRKCSTKEHKAVCGCVECAVTSKHTLSHESDKLHVSRRVSVPNSQWRFLRISPAGSTICYVSHMLRVCAKMGGESETFRRLFATCVQLTKNTRYINLTNMEKHHVRVW